MNPADPADTFWLEFTNIALGLAILLCALVVAGGVVSELVHRLRHKQTPADDRAFDAPGLGAAMADGSARSDRP